MSFDSAGPREPADHFAPLIPAALSTRDAAKYCGISQSTLKRASIPRVKCGARNSKVVYMIKDLNAWLTSNRLNGGI